MNTNHVGVDDGHYAIKVTTAKGSFMCMSRGKNGRHIASTTDGSTGGLYETEGSTLTVNEHMVEPDDTRFAEYPKSALNRVLVHHALLRAGLGGKDVKIVTGLPFASYYSQNGEKNESLIAAKMKSLAKAVTAKDTVMARIIENRVSTEAVAAYIDQIMDMEGGRSDQYDDLTQTTTGVIDFGGKTTDVAVILPSNESSGATIDTSRSGTSNDGLLMLNAAVNRKLCKVFELNTISPSECETAIRTGRFNCDGKTHDVTALIDEEKEAITEILVAGIRSKINSGRELGRLIIVGGGSIVLKKQLSAIYKSAIYPDSPEFANSRGMYKMSLSM